MGVAWKVIKSNTGRYFHTLPVAEVHFVNCDGVAIVCISPILAV